MNDYLKNWIKSNVVLSVEPSNKFTPEFCAINDSGEIVGYMLTIGDLILPVDDKPLIIYGNCKRCLDYKNSLDKPHKFPDLGGIFSESSDSLELEDIITHIQTCHFHKMKDGEIIEIGEYNGYY